MASVLSPLATPFRPTMQTEPFAIYNDGIPSLTVAEGKETEIIHGIPDQAIDEAFPPTAEEAAELEAVEVFVQLMANLSMLEEKEERARLNYDGLPKRWEARREEGLNGRPNPAKHSVEPSKRRSGSQSLLPTDCLVAYNHNHQVLEHRERAKQANRKIAVPKKMGGSNNHTKKPIQQPRKHY